MTTTRGTRSSPRTRSGRWAPFSPARTIVALCLLALLDLIHLFVSSGCSSGAICYRNTDCPYNSDCKQGQCVRRLTEAAAGATSVDDGAAGDTASP
ncbi:MAG TPA: hypothetical protein VER96_13475 [Polyangiaceae bacterium]|nr:hypothetical protein [Polyangiaceae bacterium]